MDTKTVLNNIEIVKEWYESGKSFEVEYGDGNENWRKAIGEHDLVSRISLCHLRKVKPPELTPFTREEAEEIFLKCPYVRDSFNGNLFLVQYISKAYVEVNKKTYTYPDLMKDFTLPNGSPCGTLK